MISTSVLLVLTVIAATAAISGVVVGICRYLSDGKWAAGYWWSKHDRELGPGC